MKKNRFWGKLIRWLIPIAFSLLAILLVLRYVDFNAFIVSLRKIRWDAILIGILLYLVSYLFRVYCWYTLLRKRVKFWDAFFGMGAGYLLNNIFPFRLGEIGRAVLMEDPKGPSALEVFSSVVVERVLDVFLAAVFILLMLPRVIGANYNQALILIIFILAILVILLLYFAARYRHTIKGWLERWAEKAGGVVRWVTPKINKFLEGLSAISQPKIFLLAFGSLAISWGIAFIENYVIFRNLYSNPPFWWMIFVLSAAAIGAALPSAPASLGVFEGFMVSAFALLSVETETAFTHAIIIHAVSFVLSSIIGLFGLKLRGEAVITFYRRVMNRSPKVEPAE